jgi:hypothetical protein
MQPHDRRRRWPRFEAETLQSGLIAKLADVSDWHICLRSRGRCCCWADLARRLALQDKTGTHKLNFSHGVFGEQLMDQDLLANIHNLRGGDIIHVKSDRMPSLICLIERIDSRDIVTRVITTQIPLTFNVATGIAIHIRSDGQESECEIDSLSPLPVGIHNVLLGMDRKMRLGVPPGVPILDKDEQAALDFVFDHYPKPSQEWIDLLTSMAEDQDRAQNK